MNLNQIQQLNPHLTIYPITDIRFSKYGRVLEATPFLRYFDYLENHTQMPDVNNTYIEHDPNLQMFLNDHTLFNRIFPQQTLQLGYVNGHNTKLNALEYHRSNEVNLALTPMVIFLGLTSDIHQLSYDSSKLDVFYVPARTVFEMLNTTLHFSPCKVDDVGFKCGVVLPYGTNMAFQKVENKKTDEDHLLFKTNKWLLAHPEHQAFIALGAFVGITGPNLEIQYKKDR